MNKINKIIAILSSIFLVTSMFSACNKKLQVTDCIYIGITNSDGITDTKMYLKQRFPNTNISIVDLNLGGNDCFKNVQENIYNLIKNKQLDMVIGIPEDYVSSQHDIFMDISSCISNDSVIKSVINHCSIDGHIFYITDSLYCSRFMVCNKNLLPNVTIKSLSDGFENINDMYSFYALQKIET